MTFFWFLFSEHNVEKTLKTIIKRPYIITKWKELATELGFSLEIINDIHNSANSEQDRCLNMLIKWTHKEKQNWLRSLARCVRKIGCKYVAGMLYCNLENIWYLQILLLCMHSWYYTFQTLFGYKLWSLLKTLPWLWKVTSKNIDSF